MLLVMSVVGVAGVIVLVIVVGVINATGVVINVGVASCVAVLLRCCGSERSGADCCWLLHA